MEHISANDAAAVLHCAERHAIERYDDTKRTIAADAGTKDCPHGASSEAATLSMLVRLAAARSVIAVGLHSPLEPVYLCEGLSHTGQLTIVDDSARNIAAARAAVVLMGDDTHTTVRTVHASARTFLPRLNAASYDALIVCADHAHYAETLEEAPRLLAPNGLLVFTDLLTSGHDDLDEDMAALLEKVERDERFDVLFSPLGMGMLIARKH